MRCIKIVYIVSFLSILIGCDKKDGDWEAVKIDRSEIEFSSDGGSVVITTSNYTSWWIGDIQEKIGNAPFHYVTSDDFTMVEGEWYKIEVPTESENHVFITISPNTTSIVRELSIHMTVGDTGATIKIRQQ
ncbi:BACON domain-containing protein [Parabacteroides sp. AM08-6]|uniref:BACON domain-containing protein n=1 Tax=Parabacteroides sp. AM08-6 TaxID=2292053 RepID=UPI000EFE9B3A|nr:BACON domain-containing protein [Parabacteroides sp. AM08-6]RHJ76299.1 hypothetical protein DW103_17055 [Parabacteroides sp. AM08-6]